MTLFSGGLSFLLLAAFHEWFDVLRFRFGATFLVIIGMNSILLYVMAHVLPFDQISRDMLYGTEQYLGSWYPAVIRAAEFGLAWGILWILWRQKKFLRV